MEAFVPPSSSPSHYSREAIGFLIGAGAITLLLVIAWVYIYRRGGPTKMLRTFCVRREAERKAQDIEMAEAAEKETARREALQQLAGLYQANTLVGGELPKKPEMVDFEEERRLQGQEQQRQAQGRTDSRQKDSFDLSIDPLSHTWGSGKEMMQMYHK